MNQPKPLRVAVASDQAIFRRGLTAVITALNGFYLVGEARDGIEAEQLCDLVRPDLLIQDLHPSMKADPDLAVTLHKRWPELKILLLVDQAGEVEFSSLLEENVLFLLSRDISEEEFVDALLRLDEQPPQGSGVSRSAAVRIERLLQLVSELQVETLDGEAVKTLLNHYLPLTFPNSQIHVRIFPNQEIVALPDPVNEPLAESALRWLRTTQKPTIFRPGDRYPWGGKQDDGGALILAPIQRSRQTIGGLCVRLKRVPQELENLLASIQSLVLQIAVALERAQVLAREGSGEIMARELFMAGKIQADILPEKPPTIPGWDIAARLESARETSGDFYDFLPLLNQNWGIVVADVTDKGMGAALFMALSNTLIRTYAARYPSLPALTMDVVNDRILSDTRGNMFVTAFYAVLEPRTGRLRYVNAGHPPPCLISNQKGKPVDRLRATGMALGVMEDTHWQQKVCRLNTGDVLVLYTDGVTEAQNPQGIFFGEQRLMDVIRSRSGCEAQEILDAVLNEVHQFVGEAPRQDDIAVLVICRKE